MRKYTIIRQDLDEILINEDITITPPFDDNMDLLTKVSITYQMLQRTTQLGERIPTLLNAYHLGKLLVMDITERSLRIYAKSMLTEHFRVMSLRTYYIFELIGIEQILRTVNTTASMIRTLKASDFKKLRREAAELSMQ